MKAYIATAVIALAVGLYSGSRLFSTAKIEQVEVEKEVVRKDIVTVVKEVIKPDGTKETTSTTTDKSKEKKSATTTLKVAQNQWHTSLTVSTANIQLTDLSYRLTVERRILGYLFLGVSLDSNKQVGLTAGMEF